MKKLYALALLTAALASPPLGSASAQTAAQARIKNVVLVHGAFADGSGWEAVFNILTKDGYTVAVVQQPETSFAEDVKFATAMIDRQPGPVVLVGHSYGGAVITEAGNDPEQLAPGLYQRLRARRRRKQRHHRESRTPSRPGHQSHRRRLPLHRPSIVPFRFRSRRSRVENSLHGPVASSCSPSTPSAPR